MDIPHEKICLKCHVSKPLDAFGTDAKSSDGKATRCILCKRAESAQYRKANRAKVRAASARWRAEHPEQWQAYELAHKAEKSKRRKAHYVANKAKVNVQNATYYYANKDKLRPVRRAWQHANRESLNARVRIANVADPDARRAKWRRYYAEHREAERARNDEYHAKHPEKGQEKNAKYRARKANAPINDLTHAQWLEIQAAQDHRCYYCAKRLKGKLTQDHITPLSKGGSHTVQNVIAACTSCNCRKRSEPPPLPVQPLLLTIAPAKPRTRRLS